MFLYFLILILPSVQIVDAAPVSHLPLLAPTAEAALLQARAAAAARGLAVVGAYTAPAAANDPPAVLPARLVAQLVSVSSSSSSVSSSAADAALPAATALLPAAVLLRVRAFGLLEQFSPDPSNAGDDDSGSDDDTDGDSKREDGDKTGAPASAPASAKAERTDGLKGKSVFRVLVATKASVAAAAATAAAAAASGNSKGPGREQATVGGGGGGGVAVAGAGDVPPGLTYFGGMLMPAGERFLQGLRSAIMQNAFPGDFDSYLDGEVVGASGQWLDNSAVLAAAGKAGQ